MSTENNLTQTSSIANSNISGREVTIFNDNTQTNIVKTAAHEKTPSPYEVSQIIEEMKSIVQNSDLHDDKKSKCLRRLETVEEEVKEEEPNKEYAAQTLQKMVHLLKETRNDCVVNKIKPVITRMLPWLGETKKFLVI